MERENYARNRVTCIERSILSQRVKQWENQLVIMARHNVKRRGKSGFLFNIDSAFVKKLFTRQNGQCYWLGIPLVPSIEVRGPQRPSLDRIDISKGYVKGNVVLSCQFANLGRSVLPAKRFREFVEYLRVHYQSHIL